jgi:MFS family permease
LSTPPAHGFRTFSIVWFSQSLSVFGSALTLFAITIWLTQVMYAGEEHRQQLAIAITAVAIARSLGTVLSAPLAGAWADRHDRKTIMLSMDLANGLLSLALVALLVNNALQMWTLLAIITVGAVISAFHYAAFDSSYAMLVPPKDLPRANGMMQTMSELSGIVSPALAAAIISLPALARQGHVAGAIGNLLARLSDGMALAIAVDAVTFMVAACVLLFLFIPSPRRSDLTPDGKRPAQSIWADMRVGFSFIWQRRPLLWLLASFTAANLLGSPLYVFQPLLIKYNLAADWAAHNHSFETALALMNSIASLGGLVGGVLISMWGGLRSKRVYGVLIPMVIAALAQVIFGLSSFLYLSVVMIFIVSMMIMVLRTHTQAIWQSQTPIEMQGRVFSVRRLISQFTWPLGTMIAGWVGGLFNPGWVLAVMGFIFLVFSVVQLFNRTLLRVES